VRAAGSVLEPGGDFFVGPDCRSRLMPDAPVGFGRQRLGQRGVCRRAFRRIGLLVDARAHQRVPEPDRHIIHFDQLSRDGGAQSSQGHGLSLEERRSAKYLG
jgi:hypothetical protein